MVDTNKPNGDGDSVMDCVRTMRAGGAAINFIERDGMFKMNRCDTAPDVAAALDELVARAEGYRWNMINKRYVLYPRDPVWETIISIAKIENLPRLAASEQYCSAVRKQLPALQDLNGPLVKGNPSSPVYTEPVTLSSPASLLKNLVELLGRNEQLVFTIERGPSRGARILHFQRLDNAVHSIAGDGTEA